MSGAARIAAGVARGEAVQLVVDGETVAAFRGESVAAALLASGRRTLRRTPRRGEPRGLFCVMGVCFDCLVEIEGRGRVRACMTPVEDGMCVRTESR